MMEPNQDPQWNPVNPYNQFRLPPEMASGSVMVSQPNNMMSVPGQPVYMAPMFPAFVGLNTAAGMQYQMLPTSLPAPPPLQPAPQLVQQVSEQESRKQKSATSSSQPAAASLALPSNLGIMQDLARRICGGNSSATPSQAAISQQPDDANMVTSQASASYFQTDISATAGAAVPAVSQSEYSTDTRGTVRRPRLWQPPQPVMAYNPTNYQGDVTGQDSGFSYWSHTSGSQIVPVTNDFSASNVPQSDSVVAQNMQSESQDIDVKPVMIDGSSVYIDVALDEGIEVQRPPTPEVQSKEKKSPVVKNTTKKKDTTKPKPGKGKSKKPVPQKSFGKHDKAKSKLQSKTWKKPQILKKATCVSVKPKEQKTPIKSKPTDDATHAKGKRDKSPSSVARKDDISSVSPSILNKIVENTKREERMMRRRIAAEKIATLRHKVEEARKRQRDTDDSDSESSESDSSQASDSSSGYAPMRVTRNALKAHTRLGKKSKKTGSNPIRFKEQPKARIQRSEYPKKAQNETKKAENEPKRHTRSMAEPLWGGLSERSDHKSSKPSKTENKQEDKYSTIEDRSVERSPQKGARVLSVKLHDLKERDTANAQGSTKKTTEAEQSKGADFSAIKDLPMLEERLMEGRNSSLQPSTVTVRKSQDEDESIYMILKTVNCTALFQCSLCTFCSELSREVKSHVLSHHKSTLYLAETKPKGALFYFCRHCDFVSAQQLALWHHFQWYHKVKGVMGEDALDDLPIFGLDLVKPSVRELIIAREAYRCPFCNELSLNKTRLVLHVRKTHGDKEWPSAYIRYLFLVHKGKLTEDDLKSIETVARHMKETTMFTCLHCYTSSSSQEEIEIHCIRRHGTRLLLFSCMLCQSFHTFSTVMIQSHSKEAHGSEPRDQHCQVTVIAESEKMYLHQLQLQKQGKLTGLMPSQTQQRFPPKKSEVKPGSEESGVKVGEAFSQEKSTSNIVNQRAIKLDPSAEPLVILDSSDEESPKAEEEPRPNPTIRKLKVAPETLQLPVETLSVSSAASMASGTRQHLQEIQIPTADMPADQIRSPRVQHMVTETELDESARCSVSDQPLVSEVSQTVKSEDTSTPVPVSLQVNDAVPKVTPVVPNEEEESTPSMPSSVEDNKELLSVLKAETTEDPIDVTDIPMEAEVTPVKTESETIYVVMQDDAVAKCKSPNDKTTSHTGTQIVRAYAGEEEAGASFLMEVSEDSDEDSQQDAPQRARTPPPPSQDCAGTAQGVVEIIDSEEEECAVVGVENVTMLPSKDRQKQTAAMATKKTDGSSPASAFTGLKKKEKCVTKKKEKCITKESASESQCVKKDPAAAEASQKDEPIIIIEEEEEEEKAHEELVHPASTRAAQSHHSAVKQMLHEPPLELESIRRPVVSASKVLPGVVTLTQSQVLNQPPVQEGNFLSITHPKGLGARQQPGSSILVLQMTQPIVLTQTQQNITTCMASNTTHPNAGYVAQASSLSVKESTEIQQVNMVSSVSPASSTAPSSNTDTNLSNVKTDAGGSTESRDPILFTDLEASSPAPSQHPQSSIRSGMQQRQDTWLVRPPLNPQPEPESGNASFASAFESFLSQKDDG